VQLGKARDIPALIGIDGALIVVGVLWSTWNISVSVMDFQVRERAMAAWIEGLLLTAAVTIAIVAIRYLRKEKRHLLLRALIVVTIWLIWLGLDMLLTLNLACALDRSCM
jgi:hypothetical protein